MTQRILIFTPTDEADASVTAYGHVFTAGVPLDLGEDEAAYERLKANPEFSTEGKPKRLNLRPAVEPVLPVNPSTDESNDGKDTRTRAVVQKRAILSLKAPQPEDVQQAV